MKATYGTLLKEWRETRRISQLGLSLSANVSSRHISFLETGRSRPSRDMVLNLAENLEVPRGTRNTMLQAAGFAPAYQARDLLDDDMAMVGDALNWVLSRHDPYPAIVLDRHWQIVNLNKCATLLLGGAGIGIGDSLLAISDDAELFKSLVENWQEVAHHMVHRLRTEAQYWGEDEFLTECANTLEHKFGRASPNADSISKPIVPTVYRVGETRLSLFSTLSQFSTAEDIALADLKIEHMFPADEETRAFLTSMAG